MGFWEVLGVIAAALVALNSALEAARGVTLAPIRIYRWLRRAIHAVDVVITIPDRLTALEEAHAAHIAVADQKVALLNTIATDLGVVVHEVKHNGGSSMKDDLKLVKEAVVLIGAEQTAVAKQLKITRTPKRGSTPA